VTLRRRLAFLEWLAKNTQRPGVIDLLQQTRRELLEAP